MNTKYFDINESGHSIRCKLYANDVRRQGMGSDAYAFDKVILAGHGFGGHMDNKATERFAERVLSKNKDVAIMTFNLPCHGNDVKKKLLLEDCIAYIELAISYIRDEFGVDEIYGFAISFSGYLFLKYVHEHAGDFKKLVLRCPAVRAYETLVHSIMKAGDMEALDKGKEVLIGFDRKIKITKHYLDQLAKQDVCKLDFIDLADDILVIHGTADEVVPCEYSESFCEDNVIELVKVDNADHRFRDPLLMDKAIKYTIEFMGLH